jgi:hypothetical protein
VTAPPDPGVYVIRQGARHEYPNALTFLSDGGAWDAVESIPQSVLNSIPLSNPIPAVTRYIVDTGITLLGGWSSHQVQTRAGLSITTGKIDALTHTRTTTALGGFHVGICCILTDAENLPVELGQTPMQRYGVDGTWIGNSDRTDAWFASIDPKEAQRVQEMTVYQTWQPDTFERVLEKWQKAVNVASGAAAFYSSVSGFSKATTGKAQ